MLLARILSPADMGLFATATTVVAFCALFVDSGLSEAVVQTRDITPRQLSSVFVINLAMSLVVLAGVWFAAPPLSVHFNLPELTLILRVSAFIVLLNAFAFSQTAVFRRAFKYKRLAVITLGGTLLSGAAALAMALLGMGVWSLVAQALIAAGYTSLMLWLKPECSFFGWQFHYKSIKGLLAYGVKRLITAIMDFANTRFIELFFASIFGTATLGIYFVGARIYQILMQVLCSAILDIAHNAFSRLAEDKTKLHDAYYSAQTLASATTMPTFFMLSMVASELVVGVFGRQWADAGAVMVPLLLLGGIQVLQFFNGILTNAVGRPGVSLSLMIIKTAITMGTLFAARDLTFNQIVWAYFGSQIAIAPISFYFAKRFVGISFRRVIARIWPFVASTAAAMASMHMARHLLNIEIILAKMILLLLVGGGIFVATALLLARHRVMEIIHMLRSRKVEAH